MNLAKELILQQKKSIISKKNQKTGLDAEAHVIWRDEDCERIQFRDKSSAVF